jgi:hypothetical protein
MNDRLIQSQRRLRDSLYELYEQGGLELFQAGTRGLKWRMPPAREAD